MGSLAAEERAKGSPVVEAAIDDGIVHGGAHGQPEECQVDLLDELVVVDILLEVTQDEVEVVGQPADGKGHHHEHHGLHELGRERFRSLVSLEAPGPNPPRVAAGHPSGQFGRPSVPWSACRLDSGAPHLGGPVQARPSARTAVLSP